MQKDKTRLILMALLTASVLAAVVLYGYIEISNKELGSGSVIAIAIPVLVVVFMAFFITKRYRDIKQGMPLEDERSKKVVTLAAARSFYISLYWLLAISWFEPFFAGKLFGGETLTASQTTGGGIAGMAIAFFVCWFYYNKKAS